MIRRHPHTLLALYVEGTCSAAEQAAVAAHLRRCEACARAVATQQPLHRRLQRIPKPATPPFLVQRIMARYDRLQQRASFWSGFESIPRLLQPAFVALLLAVALYFLWPARQESLYDQAVKTYASVYQSGDNWTALANDEDALRFALNRPADIPKESDHDR
ncbi:MAG TPA: zf-HC2 domain-containing protein [bacterium]|nr:zf-HC2 domain-containing protein [bacterium]HPR88617.1 zf-HC2 domain-containing protein [bacterium]